MNNDESNLIWTRKIISYDEININILKKLLFLSYINKIFQKLMIFIHFSKFNIRRFLQLDLNSAHENYRKKSSYLQIIKFYRYLDI